MNYGYENRKFIRFFHVFEEIQIKIIMLLFMIDIRIFCFWFLENFFIKNEKKLHIILIDQEKSSF